MLLYSGDAPRIITLYPECLDFLGMCIPSPIGLVDKNSATWIVVMGNGPTSGAQTRNIPQKAAEALR